MPRPLLPLAAFAMLLGGTGLAGGDDPVGARLATAKQEFEAAMGKARSGLLTDLRKKGETTQKAGDLTGLEKVQGEIKAFEGRGDLPKSVPTKGYEGQVRAARGKMEEGYGAAVKQYTMGGMVAEAKAVQLELDAFRKGGPVPVVELDSFRAKSVWVNDKSSMVLTVTERNGETFRARWVVGEKSEQEITGTVKDGKVSWLGKDVRTVRGSGNAADNLGAIGRDKDGDRIDFVWRHEGGLSGAYTLRPRKGK